MENQNLNTFQLSRRWGVTPQTLQNWRCQGMGPSYLKIGGRVLYRMEEIEEYEANHHVATNHATKKGTQSMKTQTPTQSARPVGRGGA